MDNNRTAALLFSLGYVQASVSDPHGIEFLKGIGLSDESLAKLQEILADIRLKLWRAS